MTSLDNLVKREKSAVFRIETGILKKIVDMLVGKGFYWFLPVMLAKSTDPLWPDTGASVEKRIEVEIYGQRVRTMQSMIVHKRVLVSLCHERFFILSPNIRIEARERCSTGKHLYEFTQLDLEIAYAKTEDIFRLFEEIITESISYIRECCKEDLETLGRQIKTPRIPFETYRRRELEEEYGKDWERYISGKSDNPVWVTDIPREFYDLEDEASGEWRNYDLILPEGYGEVISGAEREYEHTKLLRKMDRDGIKKEEYGVLLQLASQRRLKPSAGAGLGIERFVAYVCGLKHAAEAQPFPRIPGMVSEL
jgi:asparaginyl-tRNA synthetase